MSAGACGSKSRHEQTTVPSGGGPPLSGYVLVWGDAWLGDGGAADAGGIVYNDPDQPGERVPRPNRARATDDTGRQLGEVYVMKIVADHGDTLEVQNVHVSERDRHCYKGHEGLDTVELTMHVARADLAATTEREVTVSYPDGTAITLRAGVALGPTGPRRRVLADGVSLSLVLGEQDVGQAYQPSVALDADDQAVLGETMVAEDAELRFGDGKVEAREHPLQVAKQTPAGADVLVTLPLPCLELRVLTSPDAIGDDSWIEAGVGVTPWASETARAGATIYWPDGRVAGKTIADTALVRSDADWERDALGVTRMSAGHSCYWLRVRDVDGNVDPPEVESMLRVCFDGDDVRAGAPD